MKEAQRQITWHNEEFFKFLFFVIHSLDCKVEDEVHAARTGEMRNPYVILTGKVEGKPEGMYVLENQDIAGSIVL